MFFVKMPSVITVFYINILIFNELCFSPSYVFVCVCSYACANVCADLTSLTLTLSSLLFSTDLSADPYFVNCVKPLPWTVPRPAERGGGLGTGLTTLSRKKPNCYENIDQRNSTELGRRRASWGEYDAMQ